MIYEYNDHDGRGYSFDREHAEPRYANAPPPPVSYIFSAWSELVERHGEDGPYTAEVYTVACTASDGRRWLYIGPAECPDAETAVRHAALMTRLLPTKRGWFPASSMWTPTHPVYGSRVFEAEGIFAHADIEPELLYPTEASRHRAALERDAEVAARRRPWGNF